MTNGINTHQKLAQWLASDIGDIHDMAAIDRLNQLMERIEAEIPKPWPPYIVELQAAVELIQRSNDPMRLFNEVMRHLFVSATLTEENYRVHSEALRTGDELAHRRGSRNPLPTMDALMLMARDPRALSQCERAAVLAIACMQANEADSSGLRMLGTTLVPGEASDTLVEAAGDTRILVMASGVTYTLSIAEGFDAASLRDVFEEILLDAERFAASTDAWAGEIPLLVTAASRKTCHRVRRMIETDADNARGLAAIDGCLFAVSLDRAGDAPVGEFGTVEQASRSLFCNHANRWFGMSCLVVDAASEAGLIMSYTRGHEAVPCLAFTEAVFLQSLTISMGKAEFVLRPERVGFKKVDLGDAGREAMSEAAVCFHNQPAFFELSEGTGFFQSLGLSPNAALQYLLMMAAHETYGGATPPALSHAVSTREGAGLKGGLDWVAVSAVPLKKMRAASSGDSLELLRKAVDEHAAKVSAARAGYSPSSFVKAPADELDQLLYRFFLELGSDYETAYRSYLFRATRWMGSMDILTSTLRLPENVLFCGRPGATNEVAGMFGLHIVMEKQRTRLFFIPNAARTTSLPQIHAALERQMEKLKVAAASAQSAVCA